MSAETKYTEIVNQLNVDIKAAIKAAHDSIHDEIIPYINDDTEFNAKYRAVDLINRIIAGDFVLDGDKISVDGWRVCNLTSCDYDKLVDAISLKAGDKAKDLKIERLERQLSDIMNWVY